MLSCKTMQPKSQLTLDLIDQYWILYIFHEIRDKFVSNLEQHIQYYIPKVSKFNVEKDYMLTGKCQLWHVNAYFTDQNIMQGKDSMEFNF